MKFLVNNDWTFAFIVLALCTVGLAVIFWMVANHPIVTFFTAVYFSIVCTIKSAREF